MIEKVFLVATLLVFQLAAPFRLLFGCHWLSFSPTVAVLYAMLAYALIGIASLVNCDVSQLSYSYSHLAIETALACMQLIALYNNFIFSLACQLVRF